MASDADKGIPNLAAALLATAQKDPARIGLADFSRKVSYGDLLAKVDAVARGLEATGLSFSDHVGIALDGIDFVEAYLAVLSLGCVAVPLNPRSPAFELGRVLEQTDTATLLCGSKLGPHGVLDTAIVKGAVLSRVECIEYEGLRDEAHRYVASYRGETREGKEHLSSSRIRQILESFYRPDPDDPAVLIMTGGTSGEPRAATLTHGCMLANLSQLDAHPGTRAYPGDVVLGVLPLFHVFGLNVVVGYGLYSGSSVAFPLSGKTPTDATSVTSGESNQHSGPLVWAEAIRKLGVTVVAGSPNMYRDILEADIEPEIFSSVRVCTSGGAALSSECFHAFRQVYRQPIWEGYGMTEASPVITSSRLMDEPIQGCVGLPLPGIQLEIRDEEGHPVHPDDHGQVYIKGENVFTGYYGHPEETEQTLVEGWLRTGDIGVLGDRRELYLVDRAKDVVIVGGFNVYPSEIENILDSHPKVSAAAVAGEKVEDDERLIAFVVPSAELSSEEWSNLSRDLRQYLESKVSRYKIPRDIRVVKEIPKTALSKVARGYLLERTE